MKAGKKRKKPQSYKVRDYRIRSQADGLRGMQVKIKETDLHIQADSNVGQRAKELIVEYRHQLEAHIGARPSFFTSLAPLSKDYSAPPLIQDMYDAGASAGVGPMAAVAGGVAEYVGKRLLAEGTREIIVENGGDIFIHRDSASIIAIFAGQSPLSNRVGIELHPPMPWSVCTSSGTVGHSFSMGEADAVTVVSRQTCLADAVATRLGNIVGAGGDPQNSIDQALALAREINEVTGVVIICGELLGVVGDIHLVKLD